MNRKLFVELSELKTTVLDVLWFILAVSYSYLKFNTFNFFNGILILIVVIFIHIISNFHNNYMDYHNYKDRKYRQKNSTIDVNRESLAVVKKWMYGLTIFPLLIGAFLVYRSSFITLVMEIIIVLIGLMYSGGPKPLNSTVFGEIVVAIAISILVPLTFSYLGLSETGKFDSSSVIDIVIICLPNMFAIFSVQLCNNICYIDSDVKNGRHTLVTRIGKTNGLSLFKASWALTFLLIPILALLQVVPYITLLAILLYPFIWDKLQPFLKEYKVKTYPLVIKAVTLLVSVYVLLIAVGAIFNTFR